MIDPSVNLVADESFLVSWDGGTTLENHSRVLSFFRLLSEAKDRWSILNLHPAHASLLIDFDRRVISAAALSNFISETLARGESLVTKENDSNSVRIPVRYDGADLPEVARLTGLSVDEVIRLHRQAEYRVGFLGFAPGFPYLLGLPETLRCPRKNAPRLKVPAGSVAIAGNQCGIYPGESPGGWQLLGATSVKLFAPDRAPASWLKPGDRVEFSMVSEPRILKKEKSQRRPWNGHDLFEVLEPGFFSTIQDSGRASCAHLGVSSGGAADPLAHSVGNQLVGNPKSAASVEMTAMGMKLRFLREAWISLTGASVKALLDDRPVEMWKALRIDQGQVLKIGALEKMRAYLSVRGGIEVEPLLGSRSTFVSGEWGGFDGRPLKAADILQVGDEGPAQPALRSAGLTLRRLYEDPIRTLRVMLGPQWDWFSEESRRRFFAEEYEVTNEVNRLGLRLHGMNLDFADTKRGQELTSEGIADGAIQVPLGGQPMILFCEQKTTGGYPKIANVISADAFLVGQLKPGDRVRFKQLTFEQAWGARLELDRTLQTLGFVS